MNGLPYYKAYPRDFFEGTRAMPFDLKAAYRLLLDLIYMHGGDLEDEPRFIAGSLGCSVRAWNKHRADLIAAGKIRVENGIISNFRADKELESSRSIQEKQRENASKPRQNNGLRKAMADPKPSHTEPEPEVDMGKPISPADKPPDKARLPDDWALSDEGWAYARSQGIPDKVIEDEARGFHAYWADRRDRDAKKSARGWEQCWANRCRSIAGRYAGRGMAGKAGPGGYGQGSSIASIAARRWAAGQV